MSTETKKALAMLPLFVDSYITATRHMTPAERGVYVDLLCFQWTIGPLPKDAEALARLTSTKPREFAKVWPGIKRKFKSTAAGLVNDRLEEHRARALKRREGFQAGAAETNSKRWPAASPSDSLSDAPSDSPSASHPSPTPSLRMLSKARGN